MKEVVFFGIFYAIVTMVLLISPKPIELESCACIQIKAREGWNGLKDSVDALDLLKEAKIHQKRKKKLAEWQNLQIPCSDFPGHIYDNCYSCQLLLI